MRTRAWYWLCYLWTYLLLESQWLYRWSRLGRWLLEKKYSKRTIRGFYNVEELQSTLLRWLWTPNHQPKLVGMFPEPAAFEERLNKGTPLKRDELGFSPYAGNAIARTAALRGGMIGSALVDNFGLLTVCWLDGTTHRLSGHTAAIFRYRQLKTGIWVWAWVSSWNSSMVQWKGPNDTTLDTIGQVAAEICRQVGGSGLRWAQASLALDDVYLTGNFR